MKINSNISWLFVSGLCLWCQRSFRVWTRQHH